MTYTNANETERFERQDIDSNHHTEKSAVDGEAKRNSANQKQAHQNHADQNSIRKGSDADWKRAHTALTRFAKAHAKLDWEEGQLMLWTLRSESHARLGYATFPEYIERCLGYGPRFVIEKIRVAEALEALPELTQALKYGQFNWSVLRELTRVAVPETEHEWRKVAIGRTAREVERLVSGRRPGDRPSVEPDPSVRRHVLRFEVSGETLAVFQDALATIRRATSGPLDDDGSLLLMARHVLGGPQDGGRASYQIQLTVCETCGRGEQLGKGERVPVGPEVLAMCQCDAQHVAHPHPHMGDERENHHLGDELENHHPATKPERPMESEHTNESGSPEPVELPMEQPVSAMPDGMQSERPKAEDRKAEDRKAKTSRTQDPRDRTPRATQSIPPAIRRAVILRDGGRCVVSGCRNAVFVDVHHIRPRHEQGSNVLDNLCCICVAHHRAIHHGTLAVEGRPSSGLAFCHADGTPYGGAVSTEVAELGAQVFQALTRLGFRETDARRAIRQSLTHGGPVPAPMPSARQREKLFRRAVELLTQNTACSTADPAQTESMRGPMNSAKVAEPLSR